MEGFDEYKSIPTFGLDIFFRKLNMLKDKTESIAP